MWREAPCIDLSEQEGSEARRANRNLRHVQTRIKPPIHPSASTVALQGTLRAATLSAR